MSDVASERRFNRCSGDQVEGGSLPEVRVGYTETSTDVGVLTLKYKHVLTGGGRSPDENVINKNIHDSPPRGKVRHEKNGYVLKVGRNTSELKG